MRNQNLAFLKEAAVDFLAAVRDGKVVQIRQRTATYAINDGRRCTRRANNLTEMGAIRVSDRTADGRANHCLYELTDDGREALTLYPTRPAATKGVCQCSSFPMAGGAADCPNHMPGAVPVS